MNKSEETDVIYTYASDVEFDQDPKFSRILQLVYLYWYVTCQLLNQGYIGSSGNRQHEDQIERHYIFEYRKVYEK